VRTEETKGNRTFVYSLVRVHGVQYILNRMTVVNGAITQVRDITVDAEGYKRISELKKSNYQNPHASNASRRPRRKKGCGCGKK